MGFQDNVKHTFGNLRKYEDFIDVSLACEDGQRFEAHRVVLAASSAFFQNNNKKANLLIYLGRVKSEYLEAILDFLYVGEATVEKAHLGEFLAVASELKIAGLMRQDNEKDENILEQTPKKSNSKDNLENSRTTIPSCLSVSTIPSEPEVVKSEVKGSVINRQHQFSGNLEELDERVRSMMVKSTNLVANRRAKAYADICKVCGKEGLGSAIKNHIEVNHLEGIVLPCNHCASTFKTREGLRTHANKSHAQCINFFLGVQFHGTTFLKFMNIFRLDTWMIAMDSLNAHIWGPDWQNLRSFLAVNSTQNYFLIARMLSGIIFFDSQFLSTWSLSQRY